MFHPENDVIRQDLFVMLYNILKWAKELPHGDSGKTLSGFSDRNLISPGAEEALAASVKAGVIQGSDGKLNPTGTLTRAEMAQVLYNLLGK
jgi:hypothetical protein